MVDKLLALQLFETAELQVLQTLLFDFQRLPTKFASRAFKLSDALLHIDSDIETFYTLKSQLGTGSYWPPDFNFKLYIIYSISYACLFTHIQLIRLPVKD